MSQLKEKFNKELTQKLKKELNLTNDFAVPRVEKIVLNAGMGEAITNREALQKMSENLAIISGQKPLITKSKSAISNFKVKKGMEVGLKVTLRGQRMWDFLEKLIAIVLPRVKDFRGISRKAFDGKGNYTLGIKEHTVFPEIDPNKIDKLRSFEITIVTSARDNKSGEKLLEALGMPFTKAQK